MIPVQPQVIIAPEPFTPRVETLVLPTVGQNLAQVLAAACNQGKLELDDLERVRVYIDGVSAQELAGEGDWLDLVPVAGQIVNVAVEPAGGGGGGGNKVLQTVLTIAIVVASIWIGGPTGPLASAHLLLRTAAAAAVTVGGQMLMSAVFKPEAPDNGPEANARGALSGTSNQFRLRGPMPLALGRQRVSFDLAAAPYTQLVGEDVWLVVMFGLHYGPTTLSDVKIGETLLADYPAEDVQTETFLTPGPRNSALYPGRVYQSNFTDELPDEGEAEAAVHTTSNAAERIEVDLTLPGGLSYTNNKGKFGDATAHFVITIQEAGTGGPYVPANITNGSSAPGQVILRRASRDPVRHTVAITPPHKGRWNVRVFHVKNHQNDAENGTLVNAAGWTALRSLEAGKPVVDENLSLLVMRIKSSGDLNGSLPNVSGVLEPIVPVWNGVDWSAEAPSSNAVALARWLLTGPAAAVPLPPEQIHASAVDAYELTAERNWLGAIDLRQEMSQRDALILLGKLGRFSTYWNGRALCFVPDWEKPVPRQIFTGRNAAGYRYRRQFPEPIHAVIVEFSPLDTSAPADELIVYNDGYDETNAELFETYRLEFGCTPDRAFREGRAYLAKRELQVEVHEWKAGLDAIASTYGDRVLVRHMATLYGQAEARVDHRIFQGALVAGLKVDEVVTMEPGKSYSVDIRRSDGVLRGVLIANPNDGKPTRKLMFAAPVPAEETARAGDLLVFGETGLLTEDLEVIDVEASSDGEVTFRGVKYIAEALEAAETGPIPDFSSGLAPRTPAPVPRILGANGSPDGVTVAFDVDPIRGALLQGFRARYRRAAVGAAEPAPWINLPNLGPDERFVRTPPLTDAATPPTGDVLAEYRVDLEVRSALKSGAVSNPGKAYGVLVRRGVPAVLSFNVEGLVRTAPDGSKYPAAAITANDLEEGVVQDLHVEMKPHGAADEQYRAAATLPASNPRGDVLNIDPGRSYDFRARWRSADNWFGPWAYELDVLIPEGSRVSYAAQTIGGLTPAEFQELAENVAEVGAGLSQRLRELAQASLKASVRSNLVQTYAEQIVKGPTGVGTLLVQEKLERRTENYATVRTFDLMGAVVGDYEAFLWDEQAVEVRPGESLATWRQGLEAADEDSLAQITLERTARITEDESLATSIDVVSASLGDAFATITEEREARVARDQTFTRWFSLMGSERGDGSGWNLQEGTVILNNGQSLSSWRTQTAATKGEVSAAISSEASARATAIGAQATRIDNLQVRSAGWDGSITTLQQVTQGLGAQWSMVTSVAGNGQRLVSGIYNYNSGQQSSLIFLAQQIGFSNGPSTLYPLSIVNGIVRATNFEVDRIVANTIEAVHIKGHAISNILPLEARFDMGVFQGGEGYHLDGWYNSEGGQHLCSVYAELGTTSNNAAGCIARLRCDGVEVGYGGIYCPGSWGGVGITFPVSHTPGPGPHNYTVTYQATPGSGPAMARRSLVVVTELKR